VSSSSIERYREWAAKMESAPRFVAEELKLAFADDLVRLLEARGLKRTELAEKLGTNRGYVTRVLNTEYNLSVETMAKIALALDARISLRMLPREEVEPRPSSSAPSRTARRRERQHELASPLLAQSVASDKPARAKRDGKE
jgi:transcriptional regulator with XRE-family HTH domain